MCFRGTKKKVLQLGDSVTIDKVIIKTNSIETVDRQLKVFQGKQNEQVNRIGLRPNKTQVQGVNTKNRCARCGSEYHNSSDVRCPSRDKVCSKCGYKGHFQGQCRTRIHKRKAPVAFNKQNNDKKNLSRMNNKSNKEAIRKIKI